MEQGAKRQATQLNSDIASSVAIQGSLYYRSNASSAYDFIGQAQAIMNERQAVNTTRSFVLNDRSNLTFAQDLAARQTLQGRPETIWKTGQVAQGVAGFDNVMVGSFLPNLAGGADPGDTVNGNQVFVPSGGSVNATTKAVTNVDYREADLLCTVGTSFNIGDKVTIGAINSVGLADKNSTGQLMTFSVIDNSSTTIKIYPKPISADQAGITTLQAAYANISTAITNAAAVTRLNTDNSAKTNIFFDKSAIMVLGGTIPAEKFSEFAGMKVIHDTMKNGLELYMVYDGNIDTMTFKYKIFTWYGVTICNPSNCGVAVAY